MPSILFEIQHQVAIIRLNRPDKLNSFNRDMGITLQLALADCASDDVRAVYITGEGRAFSAGQDLQEVVGENSIGLHKILQEQFNPIIESIRNLPKPVVAAVNGVAAGAGANIALCCDIVVASASASFIQAFSKIGLIPDSGGTFFLPRLIGWQKASALMMLGDKVSATEAERLGMVYKVLPEEDFFSSSLQIATTLAAMPTQGLALTKQALNKSMNNSLTTQLALENELQQQAGATHDFKAGVDAFINKRKPVFTGK